MKLYKGDEITSEIDVYRLIVQPKLKESITIDNFFKLYGIIDIIDKSIIKSKLGIKKKYTIKEITMFFWENSNFGDSGSSYENILDEIDNKESTDCQFKLVPAYLLLKAYTQRSVRRKIKQCDFFAIKFNRWHALATV